MLKSLLSTYAQNYTFCILCSSRSLLIFLTVIVMYRLLGLYNSILPDPASRLRGRAQWVVLGTSFLELILTAPSYGYITLFPILVPVHDNCINNIIYITPNVAVSGRWAAEGMCSSNRWAMTWAASELVHEIHHTYHLIIGYIIVYWLGLSTRREQLQLDGVTLHYIDN